jgi:hypothetical protein
MTIHEVMDSIPRYNPGASIIMPSWADITIRAYPNQQYIVETNESDSKTSIQIAINRRQLKKILQEILDEYNPDSQLNRFDSHQT